MSDDSQLHPDWIARLLRFGIWLLSVAIFIVVAVLMVTGYQFNFKKATIETVGMLQIHPMPSGSNVFINDEQLTWWSNTKTNAAKGNYNIRVERDKYLPWQKNVAVRPGSIYWYHPRLIPKVKQVETVKSYSQVRASFASSNRRYLLNQLDKNLFELVDFKSNKPNYLNLDLAEFITDIAERELTFFDWVLPTDQLLFRDQANNLFLITPKDRLATINLTERFSDQNIKVSNLQSVDSAGQIAFTVSDQVLWRINLARNNSPTRLLEQVLALRVISNGLLAIVQAAPEGSNHQAKILIYNYVDNQTFEIDRVPVDQPYLMEAFHFDDGKDYLAYNIGQSLKVVSGDFKTLKQPNAVAADEPLVDAANSSVWQAFWANNPTIALKSIKLPQVPRQIVKASQGRFVLLKLADTNLSTDDYAQLLQKLQQIKPQSPIAAHALFAPEPINNEVTIGQNWWVYDVDHRRSYTTTTLANGGSSLSSSTTDAVRWLDDYNMWENLGGIIRIKEFDGQNQRKLIPALPNLDIQLSPNDKYVYFFNLDAQNQVTLYRLQMTDL